jgi:hypothetical protein
LKVVENNCLAPNETRCALRTPLRVVVDRLLLGNWPERRGWGATLRHIGGGLRSDSPPARMVRLKVAWPKETGTRIYG